MTNIIDLNDAPRQKDPGGKDDTRLLLLKSLLNQNAEAFVRWLFPAVVVKNGEGRIGDMYGSPGGSLQIGLTGEMCGVWVDHADGAAKGGDFLSLYAAAEGLDQRTQFVRIMEDLEAWAGIGKKKPDPSPRQKQREAQKDRPNPAAEPLPPPSNTWHYFDEHSNVIATVYRYDLANGAKTYRPWDVKTGRNAMPEIRPLYNLPGIIHTEPVILVEGEKCADALIREGYAATTAMGGAWAPVDRTDWTAIKGKRVILWPDADAGGNNWLTEVGRFLTALNCKITAVTIPAGIEEGWDAADAVKEGRKLSELVGVPAKAEVPARFKFLSLEDLAALPTPEWLVDFFLPSNGLGLIYGQSGSYKSFIALDLALHIAHGKQWCGKDTKRCGVAYIAAEGAFGVYKRIAAWHNSYAVGLANNFVVLPTAVNMLDPRADMDALLHDMESLRALNIGIVIIDTLARSFFGGDENTAKDMNSFIVNCDRIRNAFSCLVMPIHHSGKDDDKGARGSSSLRAAMDTEIRVKRLGTSKRVSLTCTKQKDAEEAEPIHMDAVSVEIADNQGELHKSAVMRQIISPIKPKKYLGKNELLILEALEGETTGLKHGDLVKKTGLEKNVLNRSLKSLAESGLVAKTTIGKWVRSEVYAQGENENADESTD